MKNKNSLILLKQLMELQSHNSSEINGFINLSDELNRKIMGGYDGGNRSCTNETCDNNNTGCNNTSCGDDWAQNNGCTNSGCT